MKTTMTTSTTTSVGYPQRTFHRGNLRRADLLLQVMPEKRIPASSPQRLRHDRAWMTRIRCFEGRYPVHSKRDLFDLAHQMQLCDELEAVNLLSPELKEQ